MSELVGGHSHEHSSEGAHSHEHMSGDKSAHSEEQQQQHSHAHEHESGGAEHSHEHDHTHEVPAVVKTVMVQERSEAETDTDEKKLSPAERYVIPADATEFTDESEEIHYSGTSGLKITVIAGLEQLRKLQSLTLRSCLISEMKSVASNGATLVHLELYDNQLRSLKGVEACTNLRVLDVSFNALRDMSLVEHCGEHLEELYVAANKLREMGGLAKLTKLKKLDLGANRIREIRDLENCTELRHLFLGKNRIERIGQGLQKLTKLTTLDVQCNRLRLVDGLVPGIQELYLAYNAIGENPVLKREDFEPIAETCTTIDLSHNRIADLAPLAALKKLEDLWLSYNAVPTLEDVKTIESLQETLTCIYLEHNPCSKEPAYVTFIRETFSKIQQVDAQYYYS